MAARLTVSVSCLLISVFFFVCVFYCLVIASAEFPREVLRVDIKFDSVDYGFYTGFLVGSDGLFSTSILVISQVLYVF